MPTIPVAAANNPATHGKEGVIALKIAPATEYSIIGLVSEYSLDMARDLVETTALSDVNKTYVVGLKDLKGTASLFWDRLDDTIFEAAELDVSCDLAIWPSRTSPVCWNGPAWVDASIKGGVTAAVTIDMTFSANGAWTRTPIALTMAAGSGDRIAQLEAELAKARGKAA